MKPINLLTVTAALIACLAVSGMPAYGTGSPDLEAQAWMLEQNVEGAFTDMRSSFGACYDMALSERTPAGADTVTDSRSHMMTAATCDPTFLLTAD